MFSMDSSGSFKNIEEFFRKASRNDIKSLLSGYGGKGVAALRLATPVEEGTTASSWSYKVSKTSTGWMIQWNNSHVVHGVSIAVILQLGHGTNRGGYVKGRDYINPAMRPIFDQIATSAWREIA